MKTAFSTNWKTSTQTRKQRKYRYNAPLHIKGKFLTAHLSKELRQKHGTRNMRLKKGDKVKVMRGMHAGSVGNIEKVSLAHEFIHISKVERTKKDGSKQFIPIKPSNVMILEMESGKTRQKRIDRIKKSSGVKNESTS